MLGNRADASKSWECRAEMLLASLRTLPCLCADFADLSGADPYAASENASAPEPKIGAAGGNDASYCEDDAQYFHKVPTCSSLLQCSALEAIVRIEDLSSHRTGKIRSQENSCISDLIDAHEAFEGGALRNHLSDMVESRDP